MDTRFATYDLSGKVLQCAFTVHSYLGPGLLESCYESCLEYELRKQGFQVERQVVVPLVYDGLRMENHFRLDILVEQELILEIKTVDAILPIHVAQILTYLRLSNLELGLILNFKNRHLRDGIRRVVNSQFG